jgi:6-phosphogluconolactonase
MNLSYREFGSRPELEAEGVELLSEAFCAPLPSPRVVMLTGGSTPFGVYHALAASGVCAADGVSVMVSDDRHVPLDSADSNYGRMLPFLNSLGVAQRLFVDPDIPVAISAERYATSLAPIARGELSFPLGILGLGADGHVASLFSPAQLAEARGQYAIAVRRPDGMNGVSVTPTILCAAERLVFWVAGRDKQQAVDALRHSPASIPAGLVLDAAPSIELWYAPE